MGGVGLGTGHTVSVQLMPSALRSLGTTLSVGTPHPSWGVTVSKASEKTGTRALTDQPSLSELQIPTSVPSFAEKSSTNETLKCNDPAE